MDEVEDEPMHTESIYLSSDEDTAPQNAMSDQGLTGDDDAQYQTKNQFLVHPIGPTYANRHGLKSRR